MAHRIRECMRDGGLAPLGGEGKIVEADETYYGQRRHATRVATAQRSPPLHQERHVGPRDKRAIVALVERGGRVRTFHVAGCRLASQCQQIVRENIAPREAFAHR